MRNLKVGFLVAACLFAVSSFAADRISVAVSAVDAKGVGDKIGTLVISDTPKGLRIDPNIKNLTPGDHGMHVHENPDCGPLKKDGVSVAGGAAGSHLDPAKTSKHEGPMGAGHKGDLPVLKVGADGVATDTVFAPHLTLADVLGHAIVVHGGGDNYSDAPAPLGGGGARVACAVVQRAVVSPKAGTVKPAEKKVEKGVVAPKVATTAAPIPTAMPAKKAGKKK